MNLFATEEEVTQLANELASAHGLEKFMCQLALAWHLRQRDSRHALQYVTTALADLAELEAPEFIRRQAYARLCLIRAEIASLFCELAASEQLLAEGVIVFTELDDFIGLGDASMTEATLAVEQGNAQREANACAMAANWYARTDDHLRFAIAKSWAIYELAFYDPIEASVRHAAFGSQHLQTQHPAVAAHLIAAMGVIHGRREPARASVYYQQSSELARQTGMIRLAIISAGNSGESMQSVGDLEGAASVFDWAAERAHQTEWPALIASSMSHLGSLLRQLGQLERSKKTLKEALKGFAKTPGGINKAIVHAELAECLLLLGDTEEAVIAFSEAIALFRAANSMDDLPQALIRYARALSTVGKPDLALQAIDEASLLIQEHQFTALGVTLNEVLADIHTRHTIPPPTGMAAPNASIHYLEKSLLTGAVTAGWRASTELLMALSDAWAAIGDNEKSLLYARQAVTAEQEEGKKQANNRTALAQVRHETELIRADAEKHRLVAQSEARRAETLQASGATLERLGKIGQKITSNLEPEAVFETIHLHLKDLLDATTFIIYLLSPDGKTLTQAFGVEENLPHPYHEVSVADIRAFSARCVRERREIKIELRPDNEFTAVLDTLQTLSLLFAPLSIGERILGVMSIQTPREHAYGERECLIFRTLCAYSAIALDNANAYKELRRTQQQLESSSITERQARKKAEDATRLKSEFLANMSHEIRTPMNAVIGLAHLALQTKLTTKQYDYVSKIHHAGESLLGIINDILDFSKIEAGMLDVEIIPFPLDEVLTSVSTVTSQKAAEKQVDYVFRVKPDVPSHLFGDPLRLGQVLINLINNAVKFTPTGGEIELTVHCLEHTQDKAKLNFSVRDTGIGMSVEQQQNLFQPFTQADGSTTRKYGGTGLGLSISRRLVELMGGQIKVSSIENAGSTFSFELGFDVDINAITDLHLPGQLNGARILVLTDSQSTGDALGEMLSTLPVQFTCVKQVSAALEHIQVHQDAGIDIVLIDWHESMSNNTMLAQLIYQDAALQQRPKLILMTPADTLGQASHTNTAGVDGILLKPVCMSALVDTFARLFGDRFIAANKTQTVLPLQNHSGHHVLLAEDNPVNQQIALELLSMVGIRADVAENGHEAVRLIQAAAPDHYAMIFMDLQMPVMDGHEAAALIRKNPQFKSTPIIALTAHAVGDIRERCMREGMQDYLTKPIQPEALFKMVARWAPETPGLPDQGNVSLSPVEINGSKTTLPHFIALDTKQGLYFMGGRQDFYLNMLARFQQSQADTLSELDILLAVDDYKNAERLVHTLKGLAGSIGAIELQKIAAEFEIALSLEQGRQSLLDLQEQLTISLNAVLDELNTQLPKATNTPLENALSDEEAKQILSDLQDLLQASDGDAQTLFDEHQAAIATQLIPTDMGKLRHFMHQFDFEAAAALLANK
ncbi:ATP-binding protein [Undibacterium sp. TJN19]|uniref:ATP-binding protein n=1 Tax=Undibacterium sp. TJN19 TaxID=3413055 RepID=UPI003BF10139